MPTTTYYLTRTIDDAVGGVGEMGQTTVAPGGSLADGDYGDVTVSSSGTVINIDAGAVGTAEIADDAVTFAKMQNITSGRLLGRTTASGGDVEQIQPIGPLVMGSGQITINTGTYGDITISSVSSTSDTWTIGAAAVTFAKMQNVSTDRLLGRDTAGTGSPEQLTVSGGVEFSGSGGIRRSALTGDVTCAAGSNTTAIAAGVIVNADVSASAAIAHSKLAAFGDTERLLGSTSLSSAASEIRVGGGLTVIGAGNNELSRAALTGDVTASAGSNTTTISSSVITAAARTVLDDASVTAMCTTLGAERTANKGAANGYAELDSNQRVTRGIDTVSEYFISDTYQTGLVIKDNQATPHYWIVYVTGGALRIADLGTTKP